ADAELAEIASGSLAELPTRVVLSFAQNERANPTHLDSLAGATRDPSIVEAILRNRATADETISGLATRAPANLLEVIVINQERIIRHPAILDSLLSNPDVTPDVRRRVLETREEFFEKKERIEAQRALLAENEPDLDLAVDADDSVIADLLLKAADEAEDAGEAVALPSDFAGDERKEAAWNRIQRMSMSEKVQCAYKGGKTERAILIRERNRLVCVAVMRNPRMTETEVEIVAGMRNVEEEVLRLVGTRRDWVSKYPVISILCRNPKAPIGVVLPLINRLTLRDLKNLGSDKGVSEVVRAAAKRLYQTRRNN
ncbi:MAG TPA: hypothetical protein VIL97_02840, partial [Thermoanaerobaculia bacterium]